MNPWLFIHHHVVMVFPLLMPQEEEVVASLNANVNKKNVGEYTNLGIEVLSSMRLHVAIDMKLETMKIILMKDIVLENMACTEGLQ